MKFCFGPMTKNIVDSLIDISNSIKEEVICIPSRRQIDIPSGYVNNWSTREFTEYVKGKSQYITLERDHGGPGQGTVVDDGWESLREDCKYFDILHIDPWKAYPSYKDGLEWTVTMIQRAHSWNPTLRFEVGTEEGIRPFSVEELKMLLDDLQNRLSPKEFSAIRFVVIQCGTRLKEGENIGNFNDTILKDMLALVESYGKEAKEHNGDWVDSFTLEKKKECGLKWINIAPELGELETCVYLNRVKGDEKRFEEYFQICYESGKWKKWVSDSFNPFEQKERIIMICGHYVLATPRFIEFRNTLLDRYPGLDTEIRRAIDTRLKELLAV